PRLATAPKKYKNSEMESKDFRGIVRLAGRDIDGHYLVKDAIRRLKGIGHNLGVTLVKLIEKELGIKSVELIGNLSEDQLAQIEALVKTPGSHGVFSFMLNRQNDVESGKDLHLVSTDLTFMIKQDVDRERETRSWRGWRRSIGQKVRGQRSRNTGRTGMTVGVLKKAIKAQKAAAATSAQEGGKKEEKK
ncbi:MAG: 30S ribosomal protein S13, partial [Candidatus Micrarchaeota archaeon]